MFATGLALLLLLAQTPPKATAELSANLQWALGRPVDTEWQPLILDLQSLVLKDLDVEIRIHEPQSNTRLLRSETVPAGGRRRLFLYLPTGRLGYGAFSIRPELSVRDLDGRELAAFTLTPSGRSWSPDEILAGLVTSDRAGDAVFGLGFKTGGVSVEVARIPAELLPDRWIGLAPLRLIVLHDAGLDVLSPDQTRALRDYVRQGGTLLISPGANRAAFTHPVIAGITTIDVGEPRTATEIPGLRRLYGGFSDRTPFRLHPLANGSTPTNFEETGIRRYGAGFGHVVALPFDLRQAPFDGWIGIPRLMSDLITSARQAELEWARTAGLPGDGWSGGGRAALLQRMLALINPYPSFLLLTGLTVLYLLLVGPANYLLLRRLRMTLLLVVTVPAISIAFLGMTLGLAYLIKGRSTTVTSVRILTAAPDQAFARETHLTAIFSPSTRTFDITPPAGHSALPFDRTRLDPEEKRGGSAPVEVEDGPVLRFRRVSIGQWQSWAFETRAVADLGQGIRWSIRGESLRVENGSPLVIERAILIRIGGSGFASSPVGALAPGAAVDSPLHGNRWTPTDDLGFADQSLGAHILGPPLAVLHQMYRRPDESGRVRRPEELLICSIQNDGPGATVDAALSGDSRSVSILVVRKESP